MERDGDLELQDFAFREVPDDWRRPVDIARRRLRGWPGRLAVHGTFLDLPLDARDPVIRARVPGVERDAHVADGGRPAGWHVIAAGARLAHVQDVDGRADRHWPPGMGTAPFRAIFAARAQPAPDARLLPVLNDPAQIPAGWARLADMGLVG